MIILDRAEIINFQKHSKLNIDFVKGVNVICGASRTGKSCLRRAIDWTINNTKIDAVRKEGTKKTSVKLFFSNDVILEKIRSQSTNRYVLTINGKEFKFNTVGKEVPQQIQDVIGMNPIKIDKKKLNLNIAEQIALPFLIEKSLSSFRMKLFNLLTGNELQDKLLGVFNKSLLNIGRSVKSQDEVLVNSSKDLIDVEKEKDSYQKIVDDFKVGYEKIKAVKIKLDKLIVIQENLEINEEEIEIVKEELKGIEVVDVGIFNTIIERAKRLEKLESLQGAILSNESQITALRAEIEADCSADVDFGSLEGKIERLNTLESWIIKNEGLNKEIKEIEEVLEDIEINLENQENEYKKILKETKTCPTCLSPINDECLERIKL